MDTMDTLDDDKIGTPGVKPKSPRANEAPGNEDDEVLPPDELSEDEGGAKGGDMENLDSWGLETDLEE